MEKIYRTGWAALGFKTYKEYLESDIWLEKRNFILSSNPLCEKCHSKFGSQIHHLTYEHCGNEPREDLMILCKQCHEREH